MPDLVEVPVKNETKPANISGQEAAALLLMLFGEEEAAAVLARLEPPEVQGLGEAMFAIANVSENDVNNVFDRFVEKAASRTTIGYRAEQQIEGMMHRALGENRGAHMLTRITPPKSRTRLEQLKWMSPHEITAMIEEEHPQIMAVILSNIDAEIAGQVLQDLPEAVQDDVVLRIAKMGEVSDQAILDIEELIASRKPKAQSALSSKNGGTDEAAAIMNNITKPMERRIIKALSKRDKALARMIEEQMFVFADLIGLDDKNLGTLLRTVDNDNLILALKGADDGLASKMFGCMSSRAAQSIQDDMEDRGPVSREDVIIAQKAIVAQARALADEGTIMLGGQGDDYV